MSLLEKIKSRVSFKRITASGSFIPEIDGLRFVAIVTVVIFHLASFLVVKDKNSYSDNVDYSVLRQFSLRGHFGVPLFFVISGFILGMPFAKHYINNDKSVNIKNYFLRRLTRLEPPYILILTVLFFGAVFVAKKLSFTEGLKSYFASFFYAHNFYTPGLTPKLIDVAWSLEIEVQFYILAPLLALVFCIKKPAKRRLIIICLTILFLIINQLKTWSVISLINYFQYFLIGFLLVDLYVSKVTFLAKTKVDGIIAIVFFSIIWLFESYDFNSNYSRFFWELTQVVSIFFFYYYVLFHKALKILSHRIITNIGGMCYSIYLIHYTIISMVGKPLFRHSFSNYSFINVSIYMLILVSLIMIVSALFFLFVERPCMDKDWIKKLFNKKKNKKVHAETTAY